MENLNTFGRLLKSGKLIIATLLSLLVFISSCSKQETEIPTTGPILPPTVAPTFTASEATSAFNSFNMAYYSQNDKLYYSNTEKKDIGAIWTQAIYWDIVMDAYERTKDPVYLKMVTDMYDGGAKRYDNYNWSNSVTWFIYDDMMWWVMEIGRAHV